MVWPNCSLAIAPTQSRALFSGRLRGDDATVRWWCGNAARRYLYRQSVWTPLNTQSITCYGYSHGFALRAHQQYGLSVRVTAALMGHSTETHQRHYGSWADADTVDAAIAAGLRFRAMVQSA